MTTKLKYYLLIIIPIIIVYSLNLKHDLVYCDDHEIILNSPERIDEFSDIKDEFFKGYIGTSYYRPIINISFIIDRWISPTNNFIFQFSNIIYHILATLLFFNLLIRFKIKNEWAVTIACLFGILPINVNAVSWIVGRNDVLYTIFALSSLIFLMKSSKIKYLLLSSLFTLLAFLSKETALVTPLINLYVLFFYLKYNKNDKIKYIILLVITYIIYFILKANATLGIDINYFGLDIFFKNLPVLPEFIAKIFIPIDLMALSTYGILNTITGSVLILISIFFIVYKKLYKNYTFLTGIFIFFILVGPAMFVTVSNSNDWNEYLECRAYFPTIGILLSIALALNKYNLTKNIKIIFILIGITFSFLSFKESKLYSDRFTFYESLVADDSTKALFSFILSRHYKSISNFEKEEENLLKACTANKNYYKHSMNLAIFYFHHKKIDNALQYFEITYKIDKNNEELIQNYTNALIQLERYNQAINILYDFISINNNFKSDIKLNLIIALIKSNKINEAFKNIDNNLLNNARESLFNLLFYSGEDLYKAKNYTNAIQVLTKSIEINNQFIEPYIILLKIEMEQKNYSKAKIYKDEILKRGGRIPESISNILSN